MDSCCLYRFIKTVNIRNFYDNCGGYVHQSNDMVREFHLHLSNSKLKNAATTTAHLYILLARTFDKKQIIICGTMWDQINVCENHYRFSIDY